MKHTALCIAATLALSLTSGVNAQKPVTGAHVMELTKEYLAVAPKRYIGSPGHLAAEHFIHDHFKPEAAKGNYIDDTFTARTPQGFMTMHNLLVKFPSTNPAKRDNVIVLASHYETNYWLKDINFVGANDGACTSALLIALGEYFRDHPPTGDSVWLLFTDGEESITSQWSDSDSLYGTRHIAAKWSGDGTLPHIKAFVLADMIGWKDMNVTRETNSTPWLEDLLAKAAKETGHSNYVFRESMAVDDDHIPFKQRGVPVLDIIDYKYGTSSDPEAFHHTAQDTIDKLSVQSLQVSADLFLGVIKLINEH
ncbi:glutaminyl-peptide cyclotransferase [Bryocella elongata]|uniref:Glutaminyl-peptide cyclotransferase n=1 Tax=Bryocella elongata TaxID=863522 RepID=A0A1H5ZEH0_9BACT|nr:M28 family peptidase [Bryocella elongata]SEG34125.1 glutaminyl-peptide cyclotransferase [Bryocella elongata]